MDVQLKSLRGEVIAKETSTAVVVYDEEKKDEGRQNACTKMGLNANTEKVISEALRVDNARSEHDRNEQEKIQNRQGQHMEKAIRLHNVAKKFLDVNAVGDWHGNLSSEELKDILVQMLSVKTNATAISTLEKLLETSIIEQSEDVVVEKIMSHQIHALLDDDDDDL